MLGPWVDKVYFPMRPGWGGLSLNSNVNLWEPGLPEFHRGLGAWIPLSWVGWGLWFSVSWGLSRSPWSWCLGSLKPRYYFPRGQALSRESRAQSQARFPCLGARRFPGAEDPHPHSFQPPVAASNPLHSRPLPSPGQVQGTRQQRCGRCQGCGQSPERGRCWGLPWGTGGGAGAAHERRRVPRHGRPGAAPCGPHAPPPASWHPPHTASPPWMPLPGWLPDAGLSAGAQGRG